MLEYERLLRFVFDKGRWQGAAFLRPEIFDVQRIQPYPSAAPSRTIRTIYSQNI